MRDEHQNPIHGVGHDLTSPTGVPGCDMRNYEADPRPKDGPVPMSTRSLPPVTHPASFQPERAEPDIYR